MQKTGLFVYHKHSCKYTLLSSHCQGYVYSILIYIILVKNFFISYLNKYIYIQYGNIYLFLILTIFRTTQLSVLSIVKHANILWVYWPIKLTQELVTMSITLTLTGNSSTLGADYFPQIELDREYECGLVDLQTYHSFPNIDYSNNLFHIDNLVIEIPVGSYELNDISEYLNKELAKIPYNENDGASEIFLYANNNTLNSMLVSTKNVYFNKERSVGALLGFSKRELDANILQTSDLPVNINKVNTIRVECNIITGSYSNGKKSHVLHEFSPMTEPGYKIVEVPKNVIYLPMNVKTISTLIVKLVDQDGDTINFRGEQITIRLHLKPKYVGV